MVRLQEIRSFEEVKFDLAVHDLKKVVQGHNPYKHIRDKLKSNQVNYSILDNLNTVNETINQIDAIFTNPIAKMYERLNTDNYERAQPHEQMSFRL